MEIITAGRLTGSAFYSSSAGTITCTDNISALSATKLAVVPKEFPVSLQVLYDIANFTRSDYNHTRANAPEVEFQLSGAVGAAIRVDDYKLIIGCETLAGCARYPL